MSLLALCIAINAGSVTWNKPLKQALWIVLATHFTTHCLSKHIHRFAEICEKGIYYWWHHMHILYDFYVPSSFMHFAGHWKICCFRKTKTLAVQYHQIYIASLARQADWNSFGIPCTSSAQWHEQEDQYQAMSYNVCCGVVYHNLFD